MRAELRAAVGDKAAARRTRSVLLLLPVESAVVEPQGRPVRRMSTGSCLQASGPRGKRMHPPCATTCAAQPFFHVPDTCARRVHASGFRLRHRVRVLGRTVTSRRASPVVEPWPPGIRINGCRSILTVCKRSPRLQHTCATIEQSSRIDPGYCSARGNPGGTRHQRRIGGQVPRGALGRDLCGARVALGVAVACVRWAARACERRASRLRAAACWRPACGGGQVSAVRPATHGCSRARGEVARLSRARARARAAAQRPPDGSRAGGRC